MTPYLKTFKKDKLFVSCGSFFYLDPNGIVYTWGYNDFGQLGLGCTMHQHTPCRVDAFKNEPIQQVTSQGNSTFFITRSGVVYACGYNRLGQLGLGHKKDPVLTPERLCTLPIPVHQDKPSVTAFFNLLDEKLTSEQNAQDKAMMLHFIRYCALHNIHINIETMQQNDMPVIAHAVRHIILSFEQQITTLSQNQDSVSYQKIVQLQATIQGVVNIMMDTQEPNKQQKIVEALDRLAKDEKIERTSNIISESIMSARQAFSINTIEQDSSESDDDFPVKKSFF